MNIYMCVYMNIYINITSLCYLILYNTIFIPATYTGGGEGAGWVMRVTGAHTASGINSQMPYSLSNLFLTASWGSPVGLTFGVLKF